MQPVVTVDKENTSWTFRRPWLDPKRAREIALERWGSSGRSQDSQTKRRVETRSRIGSLEEKVENDWFREAEHITRTEKIIDGD